MLRGAKAGKKGEIFVLSGQYICKRRSQTKSQFQGQGQNVYREEVCCLFIDFSTVFPTLCNMRGDTQI